MRYFSCFSGIEAASVAWEPLGWTPVGFSEIDPFASAVLAHRFPNVRNYGDITKHHEWDIGRGSVDVLVGGSPCQAFSVAGLRKGLDDPRGQLTLVYLQLAARLEPEWIVWENVPGVLSADGGRAFGAFLGGLAELGYGFAWRVLDARFFGVPQRRRRVFLVARRAGDWQRPAEVLLEPAGLCWNPAASGEARQEVARAASDGARAGGKWWDGGDTAASLTTRCHGQYMPDKDNFAAVLDPVGTLDCSCGGDKLQVQHAVSGHLIPCAFAHSSFAQYTAGEFGNLRASGGDLGGGSETLVVDPISIQGNLIGRDAGGPQGVGCSTEDTMYTLTRGDVHGVAIPIDGRNALRDPEKFDEVNRQGVGVGEPGDPAHTVTTACVHAVAIPIQDGRGMEKGQNGFGVGSDADPAYTLDTTGAQSIAFSQNQREEVRILGDCAGALSGPGTHQATYVAQAADVRTGRLVGEISGTICAKGSGGWSNHMINPVLVPHAFYSTGGTHGLESKPDVCPPLKVGSTIGIPSPPSVMYGIDGEMNASESIIGPLKRGGEGGRIEAVAIPIGTDCHAVAFYSKNGSHGTIQESNIAPSLKTASPSAVAIPIDGRNAMRDPEKHDEVNRQGVGVGVPGDPAHTVTTACVHAVAFSCKEDASDASDIAPTLRAMSHDQSHANGGGQLAIAFKPGASADSRSIGASLDCAPTLESGGGGNNKPAVATAMVVRRLLPVECERLQGFPDGWTDVPYRGKPAPDGPRYKALGNSMAVPCMAWIGRRIQFAKESEQ